MPVDGAASLPHLHHGGPGKPCAGQAGGETSDLLTVPGRLPELGSVPWASVGWLGDILPPLGWLTVGMPPAGVLVVV